MTINERILHYLGLATVSRHTTFGIDKTLSSLKRHKVKLAIFAKDGEKTSEKAKRECEDYGVKILDGIFTKSELGDATGGGAVTVIGITDSGLANAILKLTEENL